MISLIRKMFFDRSGMVTVEFALVLPFMMLLWLAEIELTNVHIVGSKVNVAAQSAADLVTQELSMDTDKLDDILAAVDAIIAPYPVTNIGYDVASIVADSGGTISVDWRLNRGTLEAGGTIPSEVATLLSANESVIVVTVAYKHEPAFNLVIGDIDITEVAFVRPRRVEAIPLE